jgi:hypothetical protein
MGFESNQRNWDNMLGGLGGLGYSQTNHYAHYAQYANCAQAQYQSYTAEELAEQQKLREEEEARLAEEQQKKDQLRALNRPKMMKCFGGSIVCLAFAVLFFSMNMRFHNNDYNTSLVSSVMWFLDVISVGAAVGLAVLGRYYSK